MELVFGVLLKETFLAGVLVGLLAGVFAGVLIGMFAGAKTGAHASAGSGGWTENLEEAGAPARSKLLKADALVWKSDKGDALHSRRSCPGLNAARQVRQLKGSDFADMKTCKLCFPACKTFIKFRLPLQIH